MVALVAHQLADEGLAREGIESDRQLRAGLDGGGAVDLGHGEVDAQGAVVGEMEEARGRHWSRPPG